MARSRARMSVRWSICVRKRIQYSSRVTATATKNNNRATIALSFRDMNPPLVHSRHNPPRYAPAISCPIAAVLGGARVLVPLLAMDQEDSKVNEIEIGEWVLESAGQAPGQAHHQIAQVIQ